MSNFVYSTDHHVGSGTYGQVFGTTARSVLIDGDYPVHSAKLTAVRSGLRSSLAKVDVLAPGGVNKAFVPPHVVQRVQQLVMKRTFVCSEDEAAKQKSLVLHIDKQIGETPPNDTLQVSRSTSASRVGLPATGVSEIAAAGFKPEGTLLGRGAVSRELRAQLLFGKPMGASSTADLSSPAAIGRSVAPSPLVPAVVDAFYTFEPGVPKQAGGAGDEDDEDDDSQRTDDGRGSSAKAPSRRIFMTLVSVWLDGE